MIYHIIQNVIEIVVQKKKKDQNARKCALVEIGLDQRILLLHNSFLGPNL